ncbi:MAG: signal peptidase [Acidimicrobiia bacterium]|nr:signal peptidase [Acidimicrobiia bacterium]
MPVTAPDPLYASEPVEPDEAAEPEVVTKPSSTGTRALLEWIGVIVGALVVAFVIRTFLFGAYVIPTGSMEPTLHASPKDRVLVNKLSYHLHDIHRGDVVVFKRPPGESDKTIDDLIKRVVALPGETVELRGGMVLINGAPLTEPYINSACNQGTVTLTGQSTWTIPKDMLFVMGDNRCDSTDSRAFGPIKQNLVVGRAFVRVWPFSHLGWL